MLLFQQRITSYYLPHLKIHQSAFDLALHVLYTNVSTADHLKTERIWTSSVGSHGGRVTIFLYVRWTLCALWSVRPCTVWTADVADTKVPDYIKRVWCESDCTATTELEALRMNTLNALLLLALSLSVGKSPRARCAVCRLILYINEDTVTRLVGSCYVPQLNPWITGLFTSSEKWSCVWILIAGPSWTTLTTAAFVERVARAHPWMSWIGPTLFPLPIRTISLNRLPHMFSYLGRCCKVHDQCYSDSMQHPNCWPIFDNPYTELYHYSCDKEQKTVTCGSEYSNMDGVPPMNSDFSILISIAVCFAS